MRRIAAGILGVSLAMFFFSACGEDCTPDFTRCDQEVYEFALTWDDYNGDWRYTYVEGRMVTEHGVEQPNCDDVIREVEACCGKETGDLRTFCSSWVFPDS